MSKAEILKPHPWGFLIRNPQYNFWAYEFVRAPSDINSIFQSVARNCLNTILCPSVHAARRLKDLDSSFVIYCALTLHAFGRLAAAAAAAAAAADDARHLFRVWSKVL